MVHGMLDPSCDNVVDELSQFRPAVYLCLPHSRAPFVPTLFIDSPRCFRAIHTPDLHPKLATQIVSSAHGQALGVYWKKTGIAIGNYYQRFGKELGDYYEQYYRKMFDPTYISVLQTTASPP
jgi:hypothetical protein